MSILNLNELISYLETSCVGLESPTLAIFKQGSNEDALNYISGIRKKAHNRNIKLIVYDLENSSINNINNINNIIKRINEVQDLSDFVLPVKPFDLYLESIIKNNIDPLKDIDNFSKTSMFESCTAEGIFNILSYYGVKEDSKLTILGSNVGMDIYKYLKKRGYDPIICDSKTLNIFETTRTSDVIISCTGVKRLLTENDVKRNSLIIDVGLGDVSKSVYEVARETQKKNGVGAVTSQMLFKHIYFSYYNNKRGGIK